MRPALLCVLTFSASTVVAAAGASLLALPWLESRLFAERMPLMAREKSLRVGMTRVEAEAILGARPYGGEAGPHNGVRFRKELRDWQGNTSVQDTAWYRGLAVADAIERKQKALPAFTDVRPKKWCRFPDIFLRFGRRRETILQTGARVIGWSALEEFRQPSPGLFRPVEESSRWRKGASCKSNCSPTRGTSCGWLLMGRSTV